MSPCKLKDEHDARQSLVELKQGDTYEQSAWALGAVEQQLIEVQDIDHVHGLVG